MAWNETNVFHSVNWESCKAYIESKPNNMELEKVTMGVMEVLLAVCVHLVYQTSAEAETRNNCAWKNKFRIWKHCMEICAKPA